MLCLCRTCILTSYSSSDEYVHTRDADRTWLMDELRLAVVKVYRKLDNYEVYEHSVTQYNPETGEGVLFVHYINTFLKLKA